MNDPIERMLDNDLDAAEAVALRAELERDEARATALADEAELAGLLHLACEHPSLQRDFLAEAVSRAAAESVPDLAAEIAATFTPERALLSHGISDRVRRSLAPTAPKILLRLARTLMVLGILAGFACLFLATLLIGAGRGLLPPLDQVYLLAQLGIMMLAVVLSFYAPQIVRLPRQLRRLLGRRRVSLESDTVWEAAGVVALRAAAVVTQAVIATFLLYA